MAKLTKPSAAAFVLPKRIALSERPFEHHGDPVVLNEEDDVAHNGGVDFVSRLHRHAELARKLIKRLVPAPAHPQAAQPNPPPISAWALSSTAGDT